MVKDTKKTTTGAAPAAPSRRSAPTIPSNEEILVYNGFYGMLNYTSKRGGNPLLFMQFGDSDYITFGELQTMRSTQPAFFTKNWILIEDQEVLDALNVSRYYENSLHIYEFEDVFKRPIKQLKEILAKVPETQKIVLYHLAAEKIASGEIDSKKTIDALEEAFGTSFEEE